LELESCSYTTLCDKVCQWHKTGQWFSLGTLVSSTSKTDHHYITEILLKVNHHKPTNQPKDFFHWKQILFIFPDKHEMTTHGNRLCLVQHDTITRKLTRASSQNLITDGGKSDGKLSEDLFIINWKNWYINWLTGA
jgi:hypothetical protein